MLYRLGSRGSGKTVTDDAAQPRSGNGTLVIRKNRALAAGLAAVILSSLVSWVAASRIRSPAEVAARTAPPKASAITVPVEKKVLASDVVARGTVRYGAPQSVLLPGSSIRKGSPILTSAPEKGKDLIEGSVAFTVSGRPALVLQGAVPAHRDITPGTVGEDVRQLQQALGRLGFNPGRTDGVYDNRTELAVAALVHERGLVAHRPERGTAVGSAVGGGRLVQRRLRSPRRRGGPDRGPQRPGDRQAAGGRSRQGGQPDAHHGARCGPASSDQQAASRSDQQRVNAHLRVQKARRDLAKAEEEEKQAQARLDEARTRRPPPSNEEYAALNKRAQDASAKVAAAREELTAAEEAYAAASGEAGGSSQAAEPSSPSGPDPQAQVDAATAAAEVRKAADAVSFAQKKVRLASGRPGSGSTGTRLGLQIPAGEILFFPLLPVRVDEAKLPVGEEAVGPVMTVTSSRLVVESALSAADAKLVKEGDTVAIRVTESGVEATGTVTHMATTPGTNGVDPQRYYLEVTPAGLDVSLNGASVVQTISVQTTEGEVLAVPVAALSMASDGTTRVQVQAAKGPPRYVRVEPGLSAKGLVAVNPVDGELGPGDLVVVGANGRAEREQNVGGRSRRGLVAVGLACALAGLAGCGGGKADAARSDERLEEQIGIDDDGIRLKQTSAENLIRDCMKTQGFDYVPQDPAAQEAALLGGREISKDDFEKQYGYGITTLYEQRHKLAVAGPNKVDPRLAERGRPQGLRPGALRRRPDGDVRRRARHRRLQPPRRVHQDGHGQGLRRSRCAREPVGEARRARREDAGRLPAW